MGLGPAAVKLYLELWQRKLLADVDTVIEMGSQELHLPQAEFEGLIAAAGISEYDKSPFANLANYPGSPNCPSRHFYELLGAKEYRCVDLATMYGAIHLDLNEPLTDDNLYGKFDLVTDHGTNEHVFNIAETYRTMHRFCKPGGIISIFQALYGGNGYYNFDLSFFEGMAAANGYRTLFCSYSVTTKTATGMGQYLIPIARDLLNTLDWSKVEYVEISYVFQKLGDDDFKYAYQDEYLAQVQGHYGYQIQFLPDPPSRTYVPIRGQSPNGLEGDVLSSIALTKLVRHLMWRGSGRLKEKIGNRLRKIVGRG